MLKWFKALPLVFKVVIVFTFVILASGITAAGMFIDSPFGAGPNGPTGLGSSAQAAGDPAPAAHAAVPAKTPKPAVKRPAASSSATAAAQNSPWSLLSQYYTLINAGSYSEAWTYLSPAMRSQLGPYSSWAAGYSGTYTGLHFVNASGDQVWADLASGGVQYQGTWTVNSNASLITSAHIVRVSPAASPSSGGSGALVSAGPPVIVGFSGDATNIFRTTVSGWTGWGSDTATATGTVIDEGCVPSCATGTQTPYPATVTFAGLTGGAYTAVTEHILAGPMSGMQPGYPAPGDPNNETIITPTWPYLGH